MRYKTRKTRATDERGRSLKESFTWIIALLTLLAILTRPRGLAEWIWAVLGSLLLTVARFVSWSDALHAVLGGMDVYLFLIGMMLLSEQAREEGLFDWVAGQASLHAHGSSKRLFVLLYLAGTVVTVLLSNDATAVVLTPAVCAAVKRAGAKPLPHLFACAFIANAASFVLPISNPANLVVFQGHMPGLLTWLRSFGIPSVVAIGVTFAVLWFWFSEPLAASLPNSTKAEPLGSNARWALYGLGGLVLALGFASFAGWELGLPTFVASIATVLLIAARKRTWPTGVLKSISWGVIPLVAGLFVVVQGINGSGALHWTHEFLLRASQLAPSVGKLAAAFGIGGATNLMNNLPVGRVSGMAVQLPGVSEAVRNAVLVGVDLGPNLSVTGSLATILWLMALRREGEKSSGLEFLKLGMIAMPLALALSVLAL